MGGSSRSQTISTELQRIAEQACCYPDMVFTTLAHLIDVGFLREAHRRTRKSAAPGVDGVTAREYAENLEENLSDLHERLVDYKEQDVEGFESDQLIWVKVEEPVVIESSEPHILTIWMRQLGLVLDQILLTPDRDGCPALITGGCTSAEVCK